MIEWNKLGVVICERSLYMQIFNLDRSYLLLSFNLITLSSLALLSKSFLFTPYSFYEGFQDLDSMARNIQYFHPEPESTVSCRSWPLVIFHLPSSSCTILGSPVFIPQSCPLALSWDIAPPYCCCSSKLAPCALFSPRKTPAPHSSSLLIPYFLFLCLPVLLLPGR